MIRKANGRFWHDGAEITEAEYNTLHDLYAAKTKWVNDVFSGRKPIEDCPEEWQEEVAARVQEMREHIDPDPDLADDELLAILLGGAE